MSGLETETALAQSATAWSLKSALAEDQVTREISVLGRSQSARASAHDQHWHPPQSWRPADLSEVIRHYPATAHRKTDRRAFAAPHRAAPDLPDATARRGRNGGPAYPLPQPYCLPDPARRCVTRRQAAQQP